jgi:hypothetical protein
MTVTNYCPKCKLFWSPFQTHQGTCAKCGGGTERHTDHEPDADVAFEVVKLDRQLALLHEKFEQFYVEHLRLHPEK